MELGRTQKLEIVRMVDFGAYLGTEEEQVLLPKKQGGRNRRQCDSGNK